MNGLKFNVTCTNENTKQMKTYPSGYTKNSKNDIIEHKIDIDFPSPNMNSYEKTDFKFEDNKLYVRDISFYVNGFIVKSDCFQEIKLDSNTKLKTFNKLISSNENNNQIEISSDNGIIFGYDGIDLKLPQIKLDLNKQKPFNSVIDIINPYYCNKFIPQTQCQQASNGIHPPPPMGLYSTTVSRY